MTTRGQKALNVIKQVADAVYDDGIIDKHEAFDLIAAITTAAGFETNNHTGEAGESFALTYYGGELAPTGAKGYDLIDKLNRKVQVKTRKLKGSPIDGVYRKHGFDIMAVVVYDEKGFIGIIELSHDEFFEKANFREERKYWSLSISKELQSKVIPWEG